MCACRASFQVRRNDSFDETGMLRAALLKNTTRRACGDGMKRIGGFGRAAHRDGLPVRVCFPEACGKVISVKTACQTFLTASKKYLKCRRCGACGVHPDARVRRRGLPLRCASSPDARRAMTNRLRHRPLAGCFQPFAIHGCLWGSPVVGLRLQILQPLNYDQQRAPVLVGAVPCVDDRVAQQVVVPAARRAGVDAIETA